VTRIVVDASVAIKWLLPGREDEGDSDRALALLSRIRDGSLDIIQPPHWLAEIAAVLARLSPRTVNDDVADLYALELPVLDTPGMYLAACALARSESLGEWVDHSIELLFATCRRRRPPAGRLSLGRDRRPRSASRDVVQPVHLRRRVVEQGGFLGRRAIRHELLERVP
jgi:hypothetical protein